MKRIKKALALLLAVLTLGTLFATAASADTVYYPPENIITAEDAKAIALAHAGLELGAVTEFTGKLSYDDHRWLYKLDIKTADREYDCDVDAISGLVVNFESEPSFFLDEIAERFRDAWEFIKKVFSFSWLVPTK
jgi:hypothetical protein